MPDLEPWEIKVARDSLKDEWSSEWLYLRLAARDKKRRGKRAALLEELAVVEDRHAELWAGLLEGASEELPRRRNFISHRIVVLISMILGVGAVIPLIHKSESMGILEYRKHYERTSSAEMTRVLDEIIPDEVGHEVSLFQEIREGGGTAGALRSSILGANDGLGSILALIAGVAGATGSTNAIIIAGVAGLVAGSVSMAASDYVSVKGEQGVYRAQSRIQEEAMAAAPQLQKNKFSEFLQAKGLSGDEADSVSERLAEDPGEFNKLVLAEQYGIGESSFENPVRSSIYTGLAFLLAGAIPVIPFFFLDVQTGLMVSLTATVVALFIVGASRALSSLNSFFRSGIEMVIVGLGAAAVTYFIGSWLGIVLD